MKHIYLLIYLPLSVFAQSPDLLSVAIVWNDSTIVPVARYEDEQWLDVRWEIDKWEDVETATNWFCRNSSTVFQMHPTRTEEVGIPGYNEQMALIVQRLDGLEDTRVRQSSPVECSIVLTEDYPVVSFRSFLEDSEEWHLLYPTLENILGQARNFVKADSSNYSNYKVIEGLKYSSDLAFSDDTITMPESGVVLTRSDEKIQEEYVYDVSAWARFYASNGFCKIASLKSRFRSSNPKIDAKESQFSLSINPDCDGKGSVDSTPVGIFQLNGDYFWVLQEQGYASEWISLYKETANGLVLIIDGS